MSKYLQPAGNHVLVVDHPHQTIVDGIELPDNVRQQEMIFGTVIFVGPAVSTDTQPENIVCYGPYAGKTVVLEGAEFRLLLEGQIDAYVRTKEKING